MARSDAPVTRTAALGLASVLLGLGAIFVTRTETATKLFGLPRLEPAGPLVRALGFRDLALGWAMIAFARGGEWSSLSRLAAAFALVPLGDAAIVAWSRRRAGRPAVALHLASAIALGGLALAAASRPGSRRGD